MGVKAACKDEENLKKDLTVKSLYSLLYHCKDNDINENVVKGRRKHDNK